jgi:homoserine kinase
MLWVERFIRPHRGCGGGIDQDGASMSSERVTVLAPATIANVGPGFDVFGIALSQPYDLVTVERRQGIGVRVGKVEGLGNQQVTSDPKRNTAAVAAAKVLELAKADFGLTVHIKKGVRPCSGMGSSGASAAGGAFAANLTLDKPLPMGDLLLCAAKGEEASSGTLHADNVSPSLLGGFTIIRSYEPLDVVRVTPPPNLGIVAALPDVMVPTKEARGILPKQVDMKKMVFHVGHASSLAVAMVKGDLGLMARSLKDEVIEPVRAPLVPHLKAAEQAALKAGALASFLGGSGPCVASFFDKDKMDGKAIAEAIQAVYGKHDIGCAAWVTTWGEGCRRWQQ